MGDGTAAANLHPAMLTLICIGTLFLLLAGVVTAQAAVTAPEGYEDHLGFHVTSAPGAGVSAESQAGQSDKAVAREMPPLATAR